MRETDSSSRPFGLFLTVVLVVAIAAAAFTGPAAANHGGDGDVTVELPDDEDHEPGTRNASANFLLPNAKQFDTLTDIKAAYPDGVPSRCYNRDTRVFGIDRNDDEDGIRTDESAIPYASDTERTRHSVLMEFYDSDSTEPSVNLDQDDEFVISVETCIWHPEEPGWYQIRATIQGRTPDGTMESVSFDSHYFYVCDCTSERDARSTLGPPPSERTATQTPTATTTPTATATATPTPTATRSPTATRTTRSTTETATPSSTTASDTDLAGATATATATPTATTDPGTATGADGPGLGALAALIGFGSAGLLARRRGP